MIITAQNAPRNKLLRYNYSLATLDAQLWHWKFTPQQKIHHRRYMAETFDLVCTEVELDWGIDPMAKKKFTGFTTKFAAIRLDAADKKAFTKWRDENAADGDVYYTELIRAGWKGTTRYDDENDCFVWSLTQQNERDPNHDVCVTSRSDNMYEAMMLGIYKITVMYDGKKLPTEVERDNWG